LALPCRRSLITRMTQAPAQFARQPQILDVCSTDGRS
jgi:hypothetical protein